MHQGDLHLLQFEGLLFDADSHQVDVHLHLHLQQGAGQGPHHQEGVGQGPHLHEGAGQGPHLHEGAGHGPHPQEGADHGPHLQNGRGGHQAHRGLVLQIDVYRHREGGKAAVRFLFYLSVESATNCDIQILAGVSVPTLAGVLVVLAGV
jgi:hypothetical protein